MSSAWLLTGTANLVIAVCYFAIAWLVGRGLTATAQWRRNPLGLATFLIFLSCGVGHGVHVEHILLAGSPDAPTAAAVRAIFGEPHVVLADVVSAAVGIMYLAQRRRFSALLSVSLFDDVDRLQRTALEVNDDVVQGLVTARLALDLGDRVEAVRAIDQALGSSRELIDRLMLPAAARGGPQPGDLRRKAPTR